MTFQLKGRTVLVTGANGGLGTQFVVQALALGARRVYAAARTSRAWDEPRVVPLPLDLTNPDSVAAAVAAADDVDLLVNNAGIAPEGDSILGPDESLRAIFETNFFGTLRVAKAFAPVLARHGGGAMVNVLSAASWLPVPTGYAASKAAMWSASNALRLALEPEGTQVVSVLVGMVDTPMSTRWDVDKVSAASVVEQTYAGVVAGAIEVLADEPTRAMKVQLGQPAEQVYPALHEQLRLFTA